MWCKKPKPEVKVPDKPTEIKPRFALVVGHHKNSQGATNYLGESEYLFNKRIARKVQNIMNSWGLTTAILFRPTSSYSSQVKYIQEKVDELGIKYVFCLHFNSYKTSAYGCEVLITGEAPEKTFTIADFITDQLNEQLGLKERHQDGINVIHSGHNGYKMLHGIESVGVVACLVEPCFANHRTKESQAIFENEDKYAAILATAAKKVLAT